jgi:hypothetical protein
VSRGVRERPELGARHARRAVAAGARAGGYPKAAGLAVIAFYLFGVVMAGCGGGDADSNPGASSTSTTGSASREGGERGSADAGNGVKQVERRLETQSTPANDVRRVVTAVLTSGHGYACSRLVVTDQYIKTAYGDRQGCVKAQSEAGAADSLQFKGVRVADTRAKAIVVPSGGLYDGERITVSLVRDGHWVVDALESNVPVGP